MWHKRWRHKLHCIKENIVAKHEIPANFKNKYKKEEDLKCQFCIQRKEFNQSHCVEDLIKIDDLVTFFRNILTEKGNIETMKKKGRRRNEDCKVRLLF